MRIAFSDREFEFIKMLSTGRHFLKDIVVPNRDLERWANTQHEADLLGVMGEYAVSKYLKIPFDTSINLEGDGGEVDMYLGDWDIQVKATKYSTGRLVFNTKEEIKALINVLVFCDMKNKVVNILGYSSKRDVKKNMYEKDLGHGIRYCLEQVNLKPIEELNYYYQEHHKTYNLKN